MKAWFTRIRQAVTGRLMTLKHKLGKPQLQKFAALLHARMQAAKEWLKESYLIVKCALLIFAIKLYMALTPEALKGYWEWIRNLPSQFTKENFEKWWAAFLVWLKNLPETLKGLRKSGVLASLVLFALFVFMGHSATTAWLTYTTPAQRNTFQVGEMNLHVEYRNDTMDKFQEVTKDSAVFKDKALYEPGYTQVVYFKIRNDGSIPFDYKLTTFSFDSDPSYNVYGKEFFLENYLYYGVVFDRNLDNLEKTVSPRTAARDHATTLVAGNLDKLNEVQNSALKPGEEEYAALIVWMPEYIDNNANHRKGANPPQIVLGLKVLAQQHDAPLT